MFVCKHSSVEDEDMVVSQASSLRWCFRTWFRSSSCIFQQCSVAFTNKTLLDLRRADPESWSLFLPAAVSMFGPSPFHITSISYHWCREALSYFFQFQFTCRSVFCIKSTVGIGRRWNWQETKSFVLLTSILTFCTYLIFNCLQKR